MTQVTFGLSMTTAVWLEEGDDEDDEDDDDDEGMYER